MLTQLVHAGELTKTLAHSCEGDELGAVGMAAAGAVSGLHCALLDLVDETVGWQDHVSCDAAVPGYAAAARRAQVCGLMRAYHALLTEARELGAAAPLLRSFLRSRLQVERPPGSSSLKLLSVVLRRQDLLPEGDVSSICLAVQCSGEALQLFPIRAPMAADALVTKLLPYWRLVDLRPHLLSIMETTAMDEAQDVLPLLIKEVVALQDWSDWGDARLLENEPYETKERLYTYIDTYRYFIDMSS